MVTCPDKTNTSLLGIIGQPQKAFTHLWTWFHYRHPSKNSIYFSTISKFAGPINKVCEPNVAIFPPNPFEIITLLLFGVCSSMDPVMFVLSEYEREFKKKVSTANKSCSLKTQNPTRLLAEIAGNVGANGASRDGTSSILLIIKCPIWKPFFLNFFI